MLDGQTVYLDRHRKPRFYDLMRRRLPNQFAAFDIVWLDWRDLLQLPQYARKRLLLDLIRPPLYADWVQKQGVELFSLVCREDLEGVVAKLGAGKYDPTNTSWVKIKNRGYSQAIGRREFFDRKKGWQLRYSGIGDLEAIIRLTVTPRER